MFSVAQVRKTCGDNKELNRKKYKAALETLLYSMVSVGPKRRRIINLCHIDTYHLYAGFASCRSSQWALLGDWLAHPCFSTRNPILTSQSNPRSFHCYFHCPICTSWAQKSGDNTPLLLMHMALLSTPSTKYLLPLPFYVNCAFSKLKIGEYSDAAPENCWRASAVITPGDIWDTIRIGYPGILLISAIARQIIQATTAGDGGWGKIGRGGQRVEKLRWEESRVNWREGEQQGGYWRWEVWEGVPSFKAKQSLQMVGPSEEAEFWGWYPNDLRVYVKWKRHNGLQSIRR